MWIKQSGGKVFGATFTAKEQKAIDIEINRQILEADEKYQNNIDASVLYALRVYAGWGPKKLRDFYESFELIHDDLRAYYEMPDDDGWLANRKLLDIGVDVATRNRERKEGRKNG